MMNHKKYKRQYFMPPVECMDWAKKEYVEKATDVMESLDEVIGWLEEEKMTGKEENG